MKHLYLFFVGMCITNNLCAMSTSAVVQKTQQQVVQQQQAAIAHSTKRQTVDTWLMPMNIENGITRLQQEPRLAIDTGYITLEQALQRSDSAYWVALIYLQQAASAYIWSTSGGHAIQTQQDALRRVSNFSYWFESSHLPHDALQLNALAQALTFLQSWGKDKDWNEFLAANNIVLSSRFLNATREINKRFEALIIVYRAYAIVLEGAARTNTFDTMAEFLAMLLKYIQLTPTADQATLEPLAAQFQQLQSIIEDNSNRTFALQLQQAKQVLKTVSRYDRCLRNPTIQQDVKQIVADLKERLTKLQPASASVTPLQQQPVLMSPSSVGAPITVPVSGRTTVAPQPVPVVSVEKKVQPKQPAPIVLSAPEVAVKAPEESTQQQPVPPSSDNVEQSSPASNVTPVVNVVKPAVEVTQQSPQPVPQSAIISVEVGVSQYAILLSRLRILQGQLKNLKDQGALTF